MIFKMLKDDAQKIDFRFSSCPGNYLLVSNLQIDPASEHAVFESRRESFSDDDTVYTTNSTIPDDNNYQAATIVPIVDTSDLVGIFLLMRAHKDSQHIFLKIVEDLDSHQDDLSSNTELKSLFSRIKTKLQKTS